jgi:effector-binding domain-containing protein
MDYAIQVKELPAQLTLQVNKTVTMSTIGQGLGEAFQAIMAQAEAGGAEYAGPPFVVYLEECVGEFPLLLCMPVTAGCPEPAGGSGVELKEAAACTAVCTTHLGPYDKLGDAYGVLQTWLTANGKVPAGPPREIYLNEPDKVRPEELLTEIAWPIA